MVSLHNSTFEKLSGLLYAGFLYYTFTIQCYGGTRWTREIRYIEGVGRTIGSSWIIGNRCTREVSGLGGVGIKGEVWRVRTLFRL